MLDLICEGPDPGAPAGKPQSGPDAVRSMQQPQEPPKGPFNQETQYSMRYFTLTLDTDGPLDRLFDRFYRPDASAPLRPAASASASPSPRASQKPTTAPSAPACRKAASHLPQS